MPLNWVHRQVSASEEENISLAKEFPGGFHWLELLSTIQALFYKIQVLQIQTFPSFPLISHLNETLKEVGPPRTISAS